MGKSKIKFGIGFVVLLAGVLLGALLIMKIVSLGTAQGEVVGNYVTEDGTNILQVQISVGDEYYVINAPESAQDGKVYYDKTDPSMYVDRNRLIRDTLMFPLPMMILGITLVASNSKAFSEASDEKDDE